MSHYRLDAGNQRIVWGVRLEPGEFKTNSKSEAEVKPSAEQGLWEWDIPDGVYTAREVVKALGVLLEAIHVQLAEAANREALLTNIENSLAIAGRETTLPLGVLPLHDPARSELSAQAGRIGEALSKWAREFDGESRGLGELGAEVLGRLIFRSRCDHHLWTHEVTDILQGPAGGPPVMQLFNEYLHQIVLLRDALLPFENWEEVPIELKARNARGLRYTEQAHSEFLSLFLARPLDHKSLVHYAKSLLAPELSAAGYGFQYRLGTILPASLGSELARAPRYLLRWYPVKTAESVDGRDSIAFEYEYPDYYAAPRSLLGPGSPEGQEADERLNGITEAYLQAAVQASGQAAIQFCLSTDDGAYAVDLGQIFRGHRFHYRSNPANDQAGSQSSDQERPVIERHAADRVLSLSGLVTNEAGVHEVATEGNELVIRALLGKLYPENVVLLERGDSEERKAALGAGKRFGAKFLLN
ncbi:hypothetical protein SAMN05216312_11623 [Cohnella sp. OV330]|uniref:hypothetical protein n=1 Tax=Cohnella sp. OV330 TaxID=1855288 RepID=UPI0008E0C6BD|nr:hypothetical protein [Cohnella sp. OV330]SFB59835.1 hypothetical protein SAMN05216312_11623 [Cohnella sp. OV330]